MFVYKCNGVLMSSQSLMYVSKSVCVPVCVPVYCFVYNCVCACMEYLVFRNLETSLSCSHNICSTVHVQSSSVCVCVCARVCACRGSALSNISILYFADVSFSLIVRCV